MKIPLKFARNTFRMLEHMSLNTCTFTLCKFVCSETKIYNLERNVATIQNGICLPCETRPPIADLELLHPKTACGRILTVKFAPNCHSVTAVVTSVYIPTNQNMTCGTWHSIHNVKLRVKASPAPVLSLVILRGVSTMAKLCFSAILK